MVLENRPEPIMEEDGDVQPAGSVAPPQYSADGKLTVKIELQKTVENETRAAAEAAEEVKIHICAECNKSFRSGKALGGHMSSAHVQANKDLSMKKLKSKMGKQQSSGSGFPSGHGNKLVCRHCGKHFPSWKSLYGHMRCHPEREYRGMVPPSEPKTSDSPPENFSGPETEDLIGNNLEEGGFYEGMGSGRAAASDLGLSVQGWSVTAKRGRKGVNQGLSESEDKELYDAVHQLIRLVNDVGSGKRKFEGGGDGMSSNSFDTPQGPEFSIRSPVFENPKKTDLSSSSAKKLKFFDDNDDHSDAAVGKGKHVFVSDKDDHCYHYSSSDDDVEFGSKSKSEKKIKKLKLVNSITEESQHKENDSSNSSPDNDNNNNNKDKFICNTCNRRFTTHQALGGHRSSHNKFKLSIYNTIDEQIATDENKTVADNNNNNNIDDEDSVGILMEKRKSPGGRGDGEMKGHVCKICKEIFGSVEDLKVHNRSHWNIPLRQVSSDENNNTDPTVGRGLGIDLNLTPEEMRYGDGMQSGDNPYA